LALGEIILKAGWPQEAIAVMPLSNADTAWLAEKEDRIKLVTFTGSSKVGWDLKAHSGRKRVVLELGSNAALIVHGDWPDLDGAALRTAHGAFGHAGQSCISVQRVFVERKVFQTFLWKLVDCAKGLAVGDPGDDATDVGPLIRPAEAERVEAWNQGGGRRRSQADYRRRTPRFRCQPDHPYRHQARDEGARRGGLRPGGSCGAV
jgi:acyl-CoA reductase-like NAD-dependent aldehyde dehydrogenase